MSNKNNYASIKNIGSVIDTDRNNDPASYCINKTIDLSFQHGSDRYGQHCLPCQVYMADKCANNWDDICEYISKNTSTSYQNNLQNSIGNDNITKNMTAGNTLLRNTFSKKYLTAISL